MSANCSNSTQLRARARASQTLNRCAQCLRVQTLNDPTPLQANTYANGWTSVHLACRRPSRHQRFSRPPPPLLLKQQIKTPLSSGRCRFASLPLDLVTRTCAPVLQNVANRMRAVQSAIAIAIAIAIAMCAMCAMCLSATLNAIVERKRKRRFRLPTRSDCNFVAACARSALARSPTRYLTRAAPLARRNQPDAINLFTFPVAQTVFARLRMRPTRSMSDAFRAVAVSSVADTNNETTPLL